MWTGGLRFVFATSDYDSVPVHRSAAGDAPFAVAEVPSRASRKRRVVCRLWGAGRGGKGSALQPLCARPEHCSAANAGRPLAITKHGGRPCDGESASSSGLGVVFWRRADCGRGSCQEQERHDGMRAQYVNRDNLRLTNPPAIRPSPAPARPLPPTPPLPAPHPRRLPAPTPHHPHPLRPQPHQRAACHACRYGPR
jgi:hypothetical protein